MTSQQEIQHQVRRTTPVSAPPEQRADVIALYRLLRADPACRLVGPDGKSIPIPESVFYLLERVVEVLSLGQAVSIVPVGQQLTTQQAADLLNVSRQYLVRLLDEGHIPYTKTGKHRRLRIEDVLGFKAKRDIERGKSLDELTRLSEELGGYPDLE